MMGRVVVVVGRKRLMLVGNNTVLIMGETEGVEGRDSVYGKRKC